MKVKAIKDYYDLKLKKNVLVKDNEVFEVSEERAKELTTADNKAGYPVCVVVEEENTELVTEAVAPLSEDLAEDAETVAPADETEPEQADAPADETKPANRGRKKKEE